MVRWTLTICYKEVNVCFYRWAYFISEIQTSCDGMKTKVNRWSSYKKKKNRLFIPGLWWLLFKKIFSCLSCWTVFCLQYLLCFFCFFFNFPLALGFSQMPPERIAQLNRVCTLELGVLHGLLLCRLLLSLPSHCRVAEVKSFLQWATSRKWHSMYQ